MSSKKRVLQVQNRSIENETPRMVTRSAAKQVLDVEIVPPTKKKKIEQNVADENKENQEEIPVPAVIVVDDDEESSDDEVDEIDYGTDSKDRKHQGQDHPKNKQYLVFEKSSGENFVISKSAFYWSNRYLKKIPHVYPDAYRMYIHADFSCYGELEIVENCLVDLMMAVFTENTLWRKLKVKEKINYVLGFRRLEALTILLNQTDSISGIDDGERYYEIMRVVGACYVTILRGLLPSAMFKRCKKIDAKLVKELKKIARKIPNFKKVLELAMTVGELYLSIADVFSAYTSIINIVYQNWIFLLEQRTIDLEAAPTKTDEPLWKAMRLAMSIEKNGIDVDNKKETFDFLTELENYRDQYGLGGDYYDLSKWSKHQREQYSFDRPDFLRRFFD